MKEHIVPQRVLSIVAIFAAMLLMSGILGYSQGFYPDELLTILFIDLIFALLMIYELVTQRVGGYIAGNRRTSYVRIAVAFAVCCLINGLFAFLPLYCKPVMVLVIILCFAANEFIGVISGVYFAIILSITISGEYYELMSWLMLILVGVILAKGLKRGRYKILFYLMMLCANIMIPCIFSYIATKEYGYEIIIKGAIVGAVVVVIAILCDIFIHQYTVDEVDNTLVDILTEDYSVIAELKKYSLSEFAHSDKVSSVAYKAAKHLGYNPKLCAAGGFYYRMGKWEGEPHVASGVKKAQRLCFPSDLVDILYEYYGEEKLPSTPESALVHMTDALVTKLDHIKADVDNNAWNREMIIMQTLNEFSASGIYDKSGLSMNQFLKIREYFSKENLLK